VRARITVLTLLTLVLPLVVRAEVYNDGGSHVLDHAINERVQVWNATTLEVVPGALIVPVTDTYGLTAQSGSTIILRGGRIESGTNASAGVALATWDSDVQVFDGVVLQGGVSTGTTGGKGAHIDARSPYSCRIDGGEFLGRDNPDHGGAGATIRGNFLITGGEFRGGHGSASSGGIGLWLIQGDGSIDNAEVIGGDGGLNGRTALVVSDTRLTIFGGNFHGGSGPDWGGNGIKAQNSSFVTIHGGDFRAGTIEGPNRQSLTVVDDSVVELRGGSYDAEMLLTGTGRLFVYGPDVALEHGLHIRGTLQDGTAIDVPVYRQDEAEVIMVDAVDAETTSIGRIKARY
jgi:hypothetical protein